MAQSKPQVKNRFARTRKDHSSELAEDYVEAINEIIAENQVCRLIDLARCFQVSHVSANRTVARLKRDGLVESEPYGPLSLTPKGKAIAVESQKRHAVVLEFLLLLGVSRSVAEADSEGMEHHVSNQTLQAMKEFINSRTV